MDLSTKNGLSLWFFTRESIKIQDLEALIHAQDPRTVDASMGRGLGL